MLEKGVIIRCLLGEKNKELPYRYVHDELLKVLKKHDGKQPTKRIANDLQKEHPSWTVYWSTEHGMYQVKVWGGDSGIECKDRYSGLIGYKSCSAVVDSERFDKDYDASAGEAAREREQETLSACSDGAVVDEVLQVAMMMKAVRDAKEKILAEVRAKYGCSVESALDKLIGGVE